MAPAWCIGTKRSGLRCAPSRLGGDFNLARLAAGAFEADDSFGGKIAALRTPRGKFHQGGLRFVKSALGNFGALDNSVQPSRLEAVLSIAHEPRSVDIGLVKAFLVHVQRDLTASNLIENLNQHFRHICSGEKAPLRLDSRHCRILLRTGQRSGEALHGRIWRGLAIDGSLQPIRDFSIQAALRRLRLGFQALAQLWIYAQGVRRLLLRLHPLIIDSFRFFHKEST